MCRIKGEDNCEAHLMQTKGDVGDMMRGKGRQRGGRAGDRRREFEEGGEQSIPVGVDIEILNADEVANIRKIGIQEEGSEEDESDDGVMNTNVEIPEAETDGSGGEMETTEGSDGVENDATVVTDA